MGVCMYVGEDGSGPTGVAYRACCQHFYEIESICSEDINVC